MAPSLDAETAASEVIPEVGARVGLRLKAVGAQARALERQAEALGEQRKVVGGHSKEVEGPSTAAATWAQWAPSLHLSG